MSRITWRWAAAKQRPAWRTLLNAPPLGENHRAWQRYVRANEIWFPPAVASHILAGDSHLHAIMPRRRGMPINVGEVRRWAVESASIGDAAFADVSEAAWAGGSPDQRRELLQGLHRRLEMVFFGQLNNIAAPLIRFEDLGNATMGQYEPSESRSIGEWLRRRPATPLRQITINSRVLERSSPFYAVATVMHERVHDHQFVHAHGLAPAGHLSTKQLATFVRNFSHPVLWLGRYRLAPVEQDAWASAALGLLRYALRSDQLPSHQSDVNVRTSLYIAAWRHLPYYTAANPRPPIHVELLDDDA